MRLTTEQICIIKNKEAQIFGEEIQVYLFGSRTDDKARGGDIDIFIDSTVEIENPVSKTLQLNGLLQQAIGMQKIDIIFHSPSYACKPIHKPKLITFFVKKVTFKAHKT